MDHCTTRLARSRSPIMGIDRSSLQRSMTLSSGHRTTLPASNTRAPPSLCLLDSWCACRPPLADSIIMRTAITCTGSCRSVPDPPGERERETETDTERDRDERGRAETSQKAREREKALRYICDRHSSYGFTATIYVTTSKEL